MRFQTALRTIQVLGVGVVSVGCINLLKPSAAYAQVCNVFGCSQPGAGACNPFGCPNPGAGECTPFGCPASPNTSTSNGSTNSSGSTNVQRTFTIYNNTGMNVTALYLSPAGETQWGPNDLSSTLFSGNSAGYTLTGACGWDLRAQLANGSELTQYSIDTCLNSNYTLGSNSVQAAPQQQQSTNSNFGECMDRLMYQDFRAHSGPDSSGMYSFNLPTSLTNDQVQQAGFRYSAVRSNNTHQQPVVRVQVISAEQATQMCR